MKEAADEISLSRRLLLSASGEYFLAVLSGVSRDLEEKDIFMRLLISGMFLAMWQYSKTNLKEALLYSLIAVVAIELLGMLTGSKIKVFNIVLLLIALIILIIAYRSIRKSIKLMENIDPVMAVSVQNDLHL